MVSVAALVVSNYEVTDTCDVNVNTMIANVIIISPDICTPMAALPLHRLCGTEAEAVRHMSG